MIKAGFRWAKLGLFTGALVCVAWFAPVVAWAQDAGPLAVTLEALKPGVGAEGQPTLVAAVEVEPGQVLVYRATYKNRGEAELKNVAVTVPVPAGVVYVDGTARPAAAQASVDGKTFFDTATPPKDTPASAWRVLRWSPRALPAGESLVVELRARVNAAD